MDIFKVGPGKWTVIKNWEAAKTIVEKQDIPFGTEVNHIQ